MAILNSTKIEEYNKLQNVIEDIISRKKLKFNLNSILDVIKLKALEVGISPSLLDSSYFFILVLNTLDRYVNEAKIYKIDRTYFPVDFIIFNDYYTNKSKLIYYIANGNNIKLHDYSGSFINVETLKEVSINEINRFDFILFGNNDMEFGVSQSDVSLEEIYQLYYDLINEGALKHEVINHILNYYKIQSMSRKASLIDEFEITKPQLKKLSRKKKIFN